jgi:anti-sigma factor RsiW
VNGAASSSRDCDAVADLLPELALGTLGGTERADVLAHLDGCSSCREKTAGFAATVDALPLLLGEAEPPPGFEDRTLQRIRAGRAKPSGKTVVGRVLAVAAAIAAVVIVTVATVRVIDARNRDDGPILAQRVAMVGHGNYAGSAMWFRAEEPYLRLDVHYGDGDGRYTVETVDRADSTQVIGTVKVRGGRGAWSGEVEGPRPARVRLLNDEGEVWCEARFT